MRTSIMTLIILLFAFGCAHGETPTSNVAISPASEIDQILDALDVRGKSMKDFTANVTLADTDSATGTDSKLSGKILMQRLAADDARLRVFFDRKDANGKASEEKQEYMLAKGTLIDRDYQKKLEVQRQVLKPGQKMD